MAKVKVGCLLQHGIVCERGIVIDDRGNVSRDSTYESVTLAGCNQHLAPGALATPNKQPGVTLVEEEFITDWLKRNAGLGFVKAGLVYIIRNEAEGKAIALDKSKLKTGFEPLDQNALPKALERLKREASG